MAEGVLTDETEDWPKRTWDFYYRDSDRQVDDLETAAAMAGRDPKAFARDLLRLPFGKAAPYRVIEQAQALLS